jgi:hypothetical protein
MYSSPMYAIFSYVFYALVLYCGGSDYLHSLYTSFGGISFGMFLITNAHGVGELLVVTVKVLEFALMSACSHFF